MIDAASKTDSPSDFFEQFFEKLWCCSSVRDTEKRRHLAERLGIEGNYSQNTQSRMDARNLCLRAQEFSPDLKKVVLALNDPIFEINGKGEVTTAYSELLSWYVEYLMQNQSDHGVMEFVEKYKDTKIYNALMSITQEPDDQKDHSLKESPCDKIAFTFYKAHGSQYNVGCLYIYKDDSYYVNLGEILSSYRGEQERHIREYIKQFQYRYKKMPSYIEVVAEKKDTLNLRVDQWLKYDRKTKTDIENNTWGEISYVVYVDYTSASDASDVWMGELKNIFENKLNYQPMTIQTIEQFQTLVLPQNNKYCSVCVSAVVRSSDKSALKQLYKLIKTILQRDHCPLLVLYRPIPSHIERWSDAPHEMGLSENENPLDKMRGIRWQAAQDKSEHHFGKHLVVYWHHPKDIDQIQRYIYTIDPDSSYNNSQQSDSLDRSREEIRRYV